MNQKTIFSVLSYTELLELLCEDEKSNRYDNNYQRRKKAAKLPTIKQLEDFDFSFQPSIDSKLISDLATCKFIKSKMLFDEFIEKNTDKNDDHKLLWAWYSTGICFKILISFPYQK